MDNETKAAHEVPYEKEDGVKQKIEGVHVVSDGIVVEFNGGTHCFFSADFLLDNIKADSNQVLLDYDPSASEDEKEVAADILQT
jgi:hypothetical protein